jgi:hypothetical protein
MVNFFIPCCHLLHSGVPKPILINSPVLIRSTNQDSVFELESAERDGQESSHERRDALLGMAAHAIKNLSKTGVKFEDVLVWVTTNMPPDDPRDKFVCSIPVSALMTISAGVLHFGCH